MNLKFVVGQLKAVKILGISLALTVSVLSANAQQEEHKNPDVRLGQKALLDGNFKSAVTYLEKAKAKESSDPHFLYLLGYSYFQVGDFTKAADIFANVVSLDPKSANSYYYKAKSSNALAVAENNKLSNGAKEQLLQAAIGDYTKAILIDKGDVKLYQNRGIAYRDLGILKGTTGADNYNKTIAVDAYNKALSDLEYVLKVTPDRKDIQTEVKKAKIYRDNLK